MINWNELTDLSQLQEIAQSSDHRKKVIFKHSTRCSVSRSALKFLEQDTANAEYPDCDFYFLDLLNHRDISNKIAEVFQVRHESPQMLIIKDGACVFHSNHSDISAQDLK